MSLHVTIGLRSVWTELIVSKLVVCLSVSPRELIIPCVCRCVRRYCHYRQVSV